MLRWSASLLLVVVVLLGAGRVSAQGVDSNRLILSRDRNVEVLLVEEKASAGASHTLGWLYYDDLVARGYVDIGNPDDPNDDVLIDVEGNGIPDFHEDLYNLNPDRGYIGEATRCIPERIFFHRRAETGDVLRLREPELLTGGCTSATSYSPNGGPKRWPADVPDYPARPVGAVVGQRVRDATDLVDASGNFRAGAVPGLLDAYFSDRGVFPHIPNLLEPDDSQNGHMGLGNIILLSTDDDGNTCPGAPAVECLTPRLASRGPGQPASVGPIWDLSSALDGLPDYKASAFGPDGRVIAGRDVTAAINEEDRRVSLGTVTGGREIVFFLVTYLEHDFDRATDACFLPAITPEGRYQCELWGHGDINVFFSKTLLNLDLHQPLSTDRVTTVNPSSNWLSPTGYSRLQSREYGKVQIVESFDMDAWSYQQRTPHVLMLAPMEATDTWVMSWEDLTAGGDLSFNDLTLLIRGVGLEPTVTRLEHQGGPIIVGEPTFFTASVTDVPGVPLTTGSVSFFVDGDFVTSLDVDGAGTATVDLSFSSMGEHRVIAEYGGIDNVYSWSMSEELLVIAELGDGGSLPDAGQPDAGPRDAGMPDAGAFDAGTPDAGAPDSGTPDAGTPDAGAPDSGTPDAGTPDAGAPDSGTPDAGAEPDAGEEDAGTPPEPDAGEDAGAPPDAGDAGDDAGTPPDAGDAGDAGDDGGGTTPEPDAGDDAGTTPQPEPDAGDGDAGTSPDAGTEDAGPSDPNGPSEPELPGPRDLTVTGWGCGATDASSASFVMLALWLGVSFLRTRSRKLD
ncbi:Ig-like domain repeat protein [Myxococcus guangdongensis]|uniref:Ig-like domain repeat protein n=1 Tax=Myxococcus guangdongensis TaxID=2906760 RepID=UPI00225DF5F0|nr:Ig-like domain repeat protein [Myxococcus guangdongensis]